jgi:uncharacterized RDD family membrane protein YckC
VADDAAACPRCAAPLRLRQEPPPARLDRDLTLDRRGDREARPTATPVAWPPVEKVLPRTGPDAAPSRARPPVAGGERPPRITPQQWTLEEPAPAGDAESPPEPLDIGAVEDLHAGGFQILGPLGGDTAPGPPPAAPRVRELQEASRDLGAPFRPTPVARHRPEQAALPFPPEVHLRRAPAWRRVLSWLADGLLAAGLSWLLVAGGARLAGSPVTEPALLAPAAFLAALLHFVHAALGHGLAGRTLGKWMLGLLLVGPDGRRPGPGRAAARTLLSLASVALLGLGLLLALFDRKGRALHDLAARTAVVLAP